MAWVRVDDHFSEHPKHARVGPLGWGVWLAGLAYCNRNLTDGFIPRSVAMTLACFEVVDSEGRVWKLARTNGTNGEDVDMEWVIQLLVDAGLWEEVPGGYRVHDYLEYQPSKDEILSEREKKREAGRKGGLASGRVRRARAEARAKADAEARAEAGALAGAQADAQAPAQAAAKADAQAGASAGAQAGAEADAQAGAQAKSKPNPNPNPNNSSKEHTEQQDTTSLLSNSRRASDEEATAANGNGSHNGTLSKRLPRSFVEAELAAELENARKSVPRVIYDAFVAATGREFVSLEEIRVVHEMLEMASPELIAETIRKVAERERRAGRPKPWSIRYFLGAVRDAAERARRNAEVDYALPDPNSEVELERRKREAEFAHVTPWLQERGEAG